MSASLRVLLQHSAAIASCDTARVYTLDYCVMRTTLPDSRRRVDVAVTAGVVYTSVQACSASLALINTRSSNRGEVFVPERVIIVVDAILFRRDTGNYEVIVLSLSPGVVTLSSCRLALAAQPVWATTTRVVTIRDNSPSTTKRLRTVTDQTLRLTCAHVWFAAK